MTQTNPPTYVPRHVRYEQDLQDGIVNRPDASARRYGTAYVTCDLGPRCTYPVRCCPECNRHSKIKHTCQG